MTGRVVWVLHAHMPFVRHPEHPWFLEEAWLFEVMETSYLPLLRVFEGWARDQVPARVAISISPTLLAMLQDELLQSRFRAHLDRRSALWLEEAWRHRSGPFRDVADAERSRVAQVRADYETYGGNLVSAFAALQEAGVLELFTTAGTHPLLPLFARHHRFVEAQLQAAVEGHTRAFGTPPRGLWLPECGWFEGLQDHLARAGLGYTFVEASGLLGAHPGPTFGLYRGLAAGPVLVLGRDPELAAQVWSRDLGLPGHPDFLDFHRDGGFELSPDERRPFLPPGVLDGPLGLRRHRVTDRRGVGEKAPYHPGRAARTAKEVAVAMGAGLVQRLNGLALDLAPHAVAPFDAELFGHWWREGPAFVDALARATSDRLQWLTPGDLLDADEPWQQATLPPSTWGEGANFSTWVSPATASWWGPLMDAVSAWSEAVPPTHPSDRPLVVRARAQWFREICLAAASDWTFLIHHGTAPDYARRRLRSHLERAESLADMVRNDWIDPAPLAEMRATDNLFPWLDPPAPGEKRT